MINLNWALTPAALAIPLACPTLAAGQPKDSQAPQKVERPGAKNSGVKTAYDSTDGYEVRKIEGWTVLVNKRFLASQAKLADETLTLLRKQLRKIVRRVPAEAVNNLRTIRFWVEENEPHHPCMTYHPSPDWLRAHGMNPEKARSIELSNARNFLKWTEDQPWMALHELSHGYHHQFLKRGFNNAEVKRAFDAAMKSKRYDSVLRSNGKKEKAYAATNPMEFFAEASEAYFGTNDFYPVNRAELRQHDPKTFELVKKLWQDG